MSWEVRHGDCLALMRAMPDASVDAVVTDPPYELGFMGKSWDASGIAFNAEVWAEALRVLKPGGHLLAFSGSRTYHRMACAIEDAGFQIRDQIMWVYGSGFPKSLDVSKAIDKVAGAEREVPPGRHGAASSVVAIAGNNHRCVTCGLHRGSAAGNCRCVKHSAAATEAARRWDGWGTALKPAHEPICMARKPLDGTVAGNVLKHGTGAINVDGCRVGGAGGTCRDGKANQPKPAGWKNMKGHGIATLDAGRWPANFMHDGSDEATAGLGDAARFFYCAKASRADREDGCEELPARTGAQAVERDEDSAGMASPRAGAGRTASSVRNHHPTVKPTELMRYLCRLVTPPGGLVLDPFTGSGSTGRGAVLEGFRFVGCEQSAEYVAIAQARIAAAKAERQAQVAQETPDKQIRLV